MKRLLPCLFPRLQAALAPLLRNRSGSTGTVFAFGLVALVGVSGLGVDYASIEQMRGQIQGAADAAALAAAKELRLGNANNTTVETVARSFATQWLTQNGADATAVAITARTDLANKTVKVDIAATQPTYIMQMFGTESVQVKAAATAKVVGGAPICVIGLDTNATQTILMDKTAKLEAPGCAVYSNSNKMGGLTAKNYATMKAAFICSSGGMAGVGPGSFSPTPQTDCPPLPDPLAARPQPSVGPCTKTNLLLSGGMTTLTPGTYCGGITITNGAVVTLSAGVYVIKDGPLKVTNLATLFGKNVGLFLTGAGAVINFDGPSTISLTAPEAGAMAGMLMFEDRASPTSNTHQILSNNARTLLGTIYLPQGRFHVAASSPVGDLSAYTIVVARMFTLSEGPTMVLNSNYGATNIPVPAGLGPNSNRAQLVN